MRWVSYRTEGSGDRTGVLVDGNVHGLRAGTRLLDLLGDGLAEAGERAMREPAEVRALDEVRLLAPIPEPPSIRDCLCFLDHMRNCDRAIGGDGELAEVWSQIPAFYFANTAAVLGPYEDVPIAPGSSWYDFELEVGAIIGTGGRDLHPDQAEQHIAGYTLLCDWSARDLQLREMGLRIGQAKGKDNAITLGPAMVTADEVDSQRVDGRVAFEVSVTLNGEQIGKGRMDAMDWSFGEIIAYASRGVDLRPGDVFGSGTIPGGCLVEYLDPKEPDAFRGWLRPDDVVSLKAGLIGETRQRIVPGAEVIPLRSGF